MARLIGRALWTCVTLLWGTAASAQPLASAGPATPRASIEQIAADLREEIVQVPVTLTLPDGRPHTGTMVVTHFRPAGPGPFPIVVFSHGRTAATRNDPGRWRALPAARYWTRRGFALLVPTRVGYGDLGQQVDPEAAGTCAAANYNPAVAAITAQIASTVGFAGAQPWADASRVILSGVSYGGFATIAAAAGDIPGVIGAINFAGGLGGNPQARPGEPCQGARVAAMASTYGARSKVPSLWLYADNDTYWGREWPRRWFDAFSASGGNGRLASFAAVGEEGHRLMSGGFPLWRPVVDRFITSLGFTIPAASSGLPASNFAAIDDAERVPHIRPQARAEAYMKFLAADVPRAFALAPSGAWAWRSGPDAVEVALSRCQTNARTTCSLYAIDDRVVWKPQSR